MASSRKQGMRKRAKLAKTKKELDKKNIKGMANSMRVQILTILNERMNSATRIAKELGADFGEVNYEIEVLRDIDMIEVAYEAKRRGAVEVFYRATSRAMLDAYEWPAVPDAVKGGLRASLLQTMMDDAIAAIAEETFDAHEGAHMSWTPMIVDQQGWDELVEILRHTLEDALEVHKGSARRLLATDTPGISCTVSILGYSSAHEDRKVGPPTDAKELVKSVKRPKKKKSSARVKPANSSKANKKSNQKKSDQGTRKSGGKS